jgi:hypothetical protein
MQYDTPERDMPERNIPNMGQAAPLAPGNSPFTDAEWKELINTPVQVGRAMMAVSPSGGVGMTKEVMALRNSLDATHIAETRNPLLQQLGQHLQGNMESVWAEAQYVFKNRWDVANVRQTALTCCQKAVALTKKASPQDAMAYKEFILSIAKNIASAASEGGFMGIGGQTISDEEESLLKDVARTLGIQRS